MATHYIQKYESDAQFAAFSPDRPNALPIGYTANGGLRFGVQHDSNGTLVPISLANGANFMRIDTVQETGTSDSRLMYLRQRYGIAGANGETLRVFSTVTDVAAATVRGAHISLSFGDSGTVTGLGAALETTVHVPSSGAMAGTVYGVKSAIHADAATSDPAGATTLAFFAAVIQGDATGDDDVDDDAVLFHIDGVDIADGKLVDTPATGYEEADITHGIKIKVNSTILYLLASTAAPSAT